MKTEQLTSIPETMLITLWAKAQETRRSDALLQDIHAAQMIEQIDYDFSKFKAAKMSQVGVCIRAKLIDDEARRFLHEHPDGTVIQLGAGIDAGYQRLGCPPVGHWYDLDLEEAITIRRKLIPETENNSYIAMSLFDYQWIDTIKKDGRPVLIIIEGVLMYFEENKVKELMNELCKRFDKATVLTDILAFVALKHAKQHDAVGKTSHKAEFLWSVLYTEEMEKWNDRLHLTREYFMSDYDHGRYPWLLRMIYKIPYCYRRFNQRVARLDIY